MISTVIIEDEQKSRELLDAMIRKHCPELEILGHAPDVPQGIELIRSAQPELVFLDISMPNGTGFDVLEQLSDLHFEIIFATASDQHALKAIKYSACDYLLKPIDVDELKAAVDKVIKKKKTFSSIDNLQFLIEHLRKTDENFNRITLPTGNAYEIVSIKDIVRCEADGSYTTFYLSDNRKLIVSVGLKHYEELLPEKDFIRVHHHHLINMSHVLRFLKEDGGYAIMRDGSKIEISRRKKEAFMERLNRN
ncbi:MAG: LytTR family DNA-binding domain-containing protein [Bacteroidia bacterium]|jgi:two-component system LytT family response regulator|nr:LytTR family DNA-binding domain-containing protein [Bacteroidia bacterium]